MGRMRKGFNEAGRRRKDIRIVDSGVRVAVESQQLRQQQTDDANALLLPSKKRTTKDVTQRPARVRILSKKQRKYLEYVVQHETKKQRRAEVLAALQEVQLNSSYLQHMQSTCSAQNLGVKRLINSVKRGRSKTRTNQAAKSMPTNGGSSSNDNPRVVGLQISDEDDSDDDDSDSAVSLSASHGDEPMDSLSANEESSGDAQLVSSNISDQEEMSDKCEHQACSTTNAQKYQNVEQQDQKQQSQQRQIDPGEQLDLQYTAVCRTAEMQEARLALPIVAEEQTIVEAIRHHPVVILAGETGSGKTTQVPQFLYEAGYARHRMIAVTEPRRVAAISMSARVADEMALSSRQVSYQIRFDGNCTADTRIKFMTDGVLLKEIERDFLLWRYSVVVVDEAHERSVFTDILVGLLSRIVAVRAKRRQPLKLVIMSATLRVADFTGNRRLLARPPPVVRVQSRQYPVTVHWNRRTPHDYLAEALRKTCKIHDTLPAGGILIFVTGRNEVNYLVRQLRRRYPLNTSGGPRKSDRASSGAHVDADEQACGDSTLVSPPAAESSATVLSCRRSTSSSHGDSSGGEVAGRGGGSTGKKKKKKQHQQESSIVSLPSVNLDAYSVLPPPAPEDDDLLDGCCSGSEDDNNEDEHNEVDGGADTWCSRPLDVRPLYAMLPIDKQSHVFAPVAGDSARLCVVATNVAETSLTIPGVRYVIDTGKVKRRVYDPATGVSAFRVMWQSRAGADQRAGRAGRQAAGHCYRLFSPAVYQHELEEFAPAELQRRPLDDVLLQMKAMGIDRVARFPFPTPPSAEQLTAAEDRLVLLGALSRRAASSVTKSQRRSSKASDDERQLTCVTALGRAMAYFPVAPRYAKLLALSNQQGLLPYAVCLVAALSVPQLLVASTSDDNDDDAAALGGNDGGAQCSAAVRSSWLSDGGGGGAHTKAGGQAALLGDAMVLLRAVGAAEFAAASTTGVAGVSETDFCRRHGLRVQGVREVRRLRAQLTAQINLALPTAGLRVDPHLPPPSALQCLLLRQLLLAALPDHVARRVEPTELAGVDDAEQRRRWRRAYRCTHTDEPVRPHRASALFSARPPPLLVYHEVFESSPGDGCTTVGGEQAQQQRAGLVMRGLTAIEPQWLVDLCGDQCRFGGVLTRPPPYYDRQLDRVRCYMTATFGVHSWSLGTVQVDFPVGIERYRRFAMHVLLGDVVVQLAEFRSQLLAPAEVMIRSWAHLQPRTDALLRPLMLAECDCGAALAAVWRSNPRFLLDAYCQWLPEELHARVTSLWPPPLHSHVVEENNDEVMQVQANL